MASFYHPGAMRPRATLFATGAHDGVLAVPGNDLPGVLSARALCRLVHAGTPPKALNT